MARMRAVVVDPEARGRLSIAEVDRPVPAPKETLVRVAATSLNSGEVRMLQSSPAGARIGWDVAGTVEEAAADGSGPPAGTRVAGVMGTGAWAEFCALRTESLAAIPEGMSFSQAAALPVAGVTALHVVEHGTGLLTRNVLVTGAAGGVGHFAVQVAKLYGARVVGQVRREDQREFVESCGADRVVVSDDGAAAKEFGPYRLVVDGVGGAVLANALGMLAPDGVCAVYGAASQPEVTFSVWNLVGTRGAALRGAGLRDRVIGESIAEGLAPLMGLVADGRVKPHIAAEEQWTDVGRVVEEFHRQRRSGKVVMLIG